MALILKQGKPLFVKIRTLNERPHEIVDLVILESQERVFHLEKASKNNGYKILEDTNCQSKETLPIDNDPGSPINRFGRGALIAAPDNKLIFSDKKNMGIWASFPRSDNLRAAIHANPSIGYGDLHCGKGHDHFLLTVQLDRRSSPEIYRVVAVDAAKRIPHTLAEGSTLYASPQFSPDGRKIVWLEWPQGHLEEAKKGKGALLYAADWLGSGKIGDRDLIAGTLEGVLTEPRWAEDGTLYYTSNQNGGQRLFYARGDLHDSRQVQLGGLADAAFSFTEDILARSSYVTLNSTSILALISVNDTQALVNINLSTAEYHLLDKSSALRYDCIRRISERKVAITGKKENKWIVHQVEID